jgi:hypothetical protein
MSSSSINSSSLKSPRSSLSGLSGVILSGLSESYHHTPDTGTDVHVVVAAEEDAGEKNIITDNHTKEMVKYALMGIGAFCLLRAVVSTFLVVWVVLFPLAYVYLLQTCPLPESFDGKKELKRVLRGNHLPEDHPDKPKGYFGKMAAKVTASVTAEMATLPGYEQEMTPYGGAAIVARMKVPSAQIEYYWVGAAGEWRYVYSNEVKAKTD